MTILKQGDELVADFTKKKVLINDCRQKKYKLFMFMLMHSFNHLKIKEFLPIFNMFSHQNAQFLLFTFKLFLNVYFYCFFVYFFFLCYQWTTPTTVISVRTSLTTTRENQSPQSHNIGIMTVLSPYHTTSELLIFCQRESQSRGTWKSHAHPGAKRRSKEGVTQTRLRLNLQRNGGNIKEKHG